MIADFIPNNYWSGNISTNTTWGPGTIYVGGDVTVQGNATLTISPGTTVEFAATSDEMGAGTITTKAELTVYGTLNAQGVTFKSAESGYQWGSINIVGTGNPATTSSVIKNCTIKDAYYGILIYASNWTLGGPALADSNAYQNNVYSVYVYNSGYPNLPAQNNTVSNQIIRSTTWSVTVWAAANSMLVNNLIRNDGYYGIEVGGGSSNAQIKNTTIDAPYPQNSATGIYFYSSSSGTVTNTIAQGHTYGGLRSDGTTPSVTINQYLSYNNNSGWELYNLSASAPSRKVLFSNPRFVNSPGGDYHLNSTNNSPALDLGDPSTQQDNPPSNTSRIDIGRYGGTAEAGVANGSVKLEDHYLNGSTDGWTPIQGNWINSGQGTYKVTGVNGISRSWKRAYASSYTIETRMKFGGAEGKVIYAEADQSENWRLDLMTSGYARLQTPTGLYWGNQFTVSPNTWYNVRVEVVSGSPYVINVYIDGILRQQNISLGSQTPNGRIGVGSYGSTHDAEFDYVVVLNGVGNGAKLTDMESEAVPLTFRLMSNYPNPFNSGTIISYELPRQESMFLVIYDLLGQKVRTLVKENQPLGQYQISWDGLNDQGTEMGSGVYIYRLQTSTSTESRKMTLLR